MTDEILRKRDDVVSDAVRCVHFDAPRKLEVYERAPGRDVRKINQWSMGRRLWCMRQNFGKLSQVRVQRHTIAFFLSSLKLKIILFSCALCSQATSVSRSSS